MKKFRELIKLKIYFTSKNSANMYFRNFICTNIVTKEKKWK